MAKEKKKFPVPSPDGVPWEKGTWDDKRFIEEWLGLQYPPDDVLEAGLEVLKGERDSLEGVYEAPPTEGEVSVAEKQDKEVVEVDDAFMTKLAAGFKKLLGIDLADVATLKVGDKVSWTAEGKSHKGTVLSINREAGTAKVQEDGTDWSPSVPVGQLTVSAKAPSGPPGKAPPGKVAAAAPADGAEIHLGFQAPYSLADAEKLGARRFRKALLPVGKTINYERDGVKKALTFSREMLGKMVANLKAKAFDQVPLLALHPKDPAVKPEDYHGHLVDAELDDEWLYGIFETTDRGAQAIEDNPSLPTSVGYLENYVRKADGVDFGPTLQHVAFTYTPAVPGVRGWSAIQMSEEENAGGDVVVVDLSTKSFGGENREEKRLGEVITPASGETPGAEQEKEVKMETVDLAEFNALKSQHEATGRILRRQGIRKMLSDEYGVKGVPEAKINAAFTLLDSDPSGSELVTLSEMGDASFSEHQKATAIKELLEGYKGTIEFGEKGSTEEPKTLSTEEQIDRRARTLATEKEIDYGRAFDLALAEMADGQEVS
jgi:hypothetical protein